MQSTISRIKARPFAVGFLVLSCVMAFVFWGQLADLEWQAQTVLLVFTAVLAFVMGFWVSDLRATALIERTATSSSGRMAGNVSEAIGALEDALAQSGREVLATRQVNAGLLGRLGTIENCLGGLTFAGVVDEQEGFRLQMTGENFDWFFRAKRAEFQANWRCVLSEVQEKDRASLEVLLGRIEAFPTKESLVFGLERAAHEPKRFFKLTVQRSVKEGQVMLFGVLADVTELVIAKQQAETDDKAKSEFLATVSHELRTPLNAVIGFANLLSEQLADQPDLKQDAANIASAGQSLSVIVNDILDYSRIQAEGIVLDNESFDITEVLEQVCVLSRPEARKKGIEFRFVNQVAEHVMLIGDANRLRQVVLNLISNALKFTEEGYVEVRLLSQPVQNNRLSLTIEVADTGLGISKSELQNLFKPFGQANREINRRFGGTGLGLVISKGLVEKMGGSIEVTSEPGVGSLFAVQLNLAISSAKPKGEEGIEQNADPIDVLVVDDHPLNVKLLERFLSKHGHNATGAFSGSEAIEKAKEKQFDLILMDIDMPEMDGHETTARIRQETGLNRETFVCAVSGLMDEANRIKSRNVGMNEHIGKPVSFEVLANLVSRVSAQRHKNETQH